MAKICYKNMGHKYTHSLLLHNLNHCKSQIEMQRMKKSIAKSIEKTSSDTLSTNFKDSYPDEKHC